MLKKILGGLVVVIGGLCVVIAMRPSEFSIQRKTTVAAPPEVIYPLISDFHRWAEWSPWEKIDPSMKRSFDGAAAGQGAKYGWVGDKVGSGRMTIEKAQAPDATGAARVEIKLEFIKPFEATNQTVFTMARVGTATEVTWTMSGHANFMSKAFTLFKPMDAMVGPDFERGLGSLKPLAEAEAKKKGEAPAPAPAAAAAPAAPAAPSADAGAAP